MIKGGLASCLHVVIIGATPALNSNSLLGVELNHHEVLVVIMSTKQWPHHCALPQGGSVMAHISWKELAPPLSQTGYLRWHWPNWLHQNGEALLNWLPQ